MLRLFKYVCLILILSTSGCAFADELLIARTQQTFPEAMSLLQEQIKAHGYTLSRVQRVDIGLSKSGYKTDKYRVVFFGKHDDIKWVTDTYPQWVPYLPLKIAIFAEGTDTLLVASNPEILFSSDDKRFKQLIKQWHKDIRSMFDQVSQQSE